MNQNEFIEAVKELGLEVTIKKKDMLDKYLNLLIKYNKFMNLTSIIDPKQIYLKHFYDSLTITKIIDLTKEQELCDIGTGAGFPGLVLKIFYPDLNITLVDSIQKRINFLNIVIDNLNLKGISVIHSRIEDFSIKNPEKYDVVVSRAVAPINMLLELSFKMIKKGKYFISMKGNLENEPSYKKALIKLNFNEEQILKFVLPIEESCRALIKLKKINNIKLFPRKYSEIKKNPL